jgi:hypothetical protein
VLPPISPPVCSAAIASMLRLSPTALVLGATPKLSPLAGVPEISISMPFQAKVAPEV